VTSSTHPSGLRRSSCASPSARPLHWPARAAHPSPSRCVAVILPSWFRQVPSTPPFLLHCLGLSILGKTKNRDIAHQRRELRRHALDWRARSFAV